MLVTNAFVSDVEAGVVLCAGMIAVEIGSRSCRLGITGGVIAAGCITVVIKVLYTVLVLVA